MRKAIVVVLAAALVASAASAALRVVGTGEARRFDPAAFPPEIRERYDLAVVKCNNPSANCHGFARTVDAIVTGVGPNSKQPFDKEAAKAYGVKMMRKPDSGVNKKEAKMIVELLYYLIDQARK